MPTTAAVPHTRGHGAPKRAGGLLGTRTVHTTRAFKLLCGGLAGGLAATLICLAIFGIRSGRGGLASVGIAAGIVLFFYVVGQLVMVAFAEAGARTLLLVSMVSYTARVVILGLVLLAYQRNREHWPELDPPAFFSAAIGVVACWLVVEIFVFSRLRIGAFDTEYQTPVDEAEEPLGHAEPDEAAADPAGPSDRASAGGERHADQGHH